MRISLGEDPEGCWQTEAVTGLEDHMRAFQDLRGTERRFSWSLWHKTVHRLWIYQAGAQLQGPFFIYSLIKFGRLISRGSWMVAERGWALHRPCQGPKLGWRSVCLHLMHMWAWLLLGPLGYCTGDRIKDKWAVVESSEVQNCFQVCMEWPVPESQPHGYCLLKRTLLCLYCTTPNLNPKIPTRVL